MSVILRTLAGSGHSLSQGMKILRSLHSHASSRSLDPKIDTTIRKHLPEVCAWINRITKKRDEVSFQNTSHVGFATEWPWLPGHLVKLDEGRIHGGDVLASYIQVKKLGLLCVPRQYPYQIPGSNVTIAICEKVYGIQRRDFPLSLEQTKELITLIQDTGYADPRWRNLVHLPSDRIAIIDTEIIASKPRYGLHTLLEHNHFTEHARDHLMSILRRVSPYMA